MQKHETRMDVIRLIDANALCKKSKPMYGRSITGCIDHAAEGAVTLNEIHQVPTIDAVLVVRCSKCCLRGTEECPMRRLVHPVEGAGRYEDLTVEDGFCDRGKERDIND